MNDDAPAIELVDVKKSVRVGFWGRERKILHGVSLRVKKGGVFGFMGPNGAGKSTIIKILIGAVRPTSGSARVLGAAPGDLAARSKVGYMPELQHLPSTLTPREIVSLHARLCGLDPATRARSTSTLLERVGLADRADDRIGGFSKGMQQRTGLALALLGDPELLILDEPMSGLDPLGRRLVRDIIRDENRAGRTIFFSSHVLSDVEALCDDGAILHRGAVLQHGISTSTSGAARGWEIRVVPPAGAEALPPEASALGSLERHGPSFVLGLPPGEDPLEVATKLRRAGCSVEMIEPMRATLEDRLVELVREHGASAEGGAR